MATTKIKNQALDTNFIQGWVEIAESWTYSSVSGINGVITAPSDATTRYQKGDKVRYKQGGAYKYAYIIALTSTAITITGGTDYSLANSAITDMAISRVSHPFGFPTEFVIATDRRLRIDGLLAYVMGSCNPSSAGSNTFNFGFTFSEYPKMIEAYKSYGAITPTAYYINQANMYQFTFWMAAANAGAYFDFIAIGKY